jgi:hypothetical protein
LIINNQLLLLNFGEWQDESKTLADMKRVWISKKFSYIYVACPSTNLAFFMQSLYAHCIGSTYLPGICSSDLCLTIFIFKNSKCKLEFWFFFPCNLGVEMLYFVLKAFLFKVNVQWYRS